MCELISVAFKALARVKRLEAEKENKELKRLLDRDLPNSNDVESELEDSEEFV